MSVHILIFPTDSVNLQIIVKILHATINESEKLGLLFEPLFNFHQKLQIWGGGSIGNCNLAPQQLVEFFLTIAFRHMAECNNCSRKTYNCNCYKIKNVCNFDRVICEKKI